MNLDRTEHVWRLIKSGKNVRYQVWYQIGYRENRWVLDQIDLAVTELNPRGRGGAPVHYRGKLDRVGSLQFSAVPVDDFNNLPYLTDSIKRQLLIMIAKGDYSKGNVVSGYWSTQEESQSFIPLMKRQEMKIYRR